MSFDYSNIKYHGEEDFKIAINRLLEEPNMYRIGRFAKSEMSNEEFKSYLLSLKSIKEFQFDFILNIIKIIINKSIDELTSSFVEPIDPNKKYIFITNHRNIVMDGSIINHELYRHLGNDFESTAIAIGNNLLQMPWVKDLAKLNKSFIVIRDSSVQDMLENSKTLSIYIRQLIVEKQTSIWIAQREGRAKDGNDLTQPGLLKMLQMSGSKNFVENYSELHLVPVSISYEYDPCMKDKIIELSSIENTGGYIKKPMDDFNSMYNGLMGYKGRVHLSFGKEIKNDELDKIPTNLSYNERIKKLAENIDNFIHQEYKLWPNNYISTDLLNENNQFSNHYSEEEKVNFLKFIEDSLAEIEGDYKQNKFILLKMFANPLKNCNKNNDKFKFDF